MTEWFFYLVITKKSRLLLVLFRTRVAAALVRSATSEREEFVRKRDMKIAWTVQLGQNVLINLAGKERG